MSMRQKHARLQVRSGRRACTRQEHRRAQPAPPRSCTRFEHAFDAGGVSTAVPPSAPCELRADAVRKRYVRKRYGSGFVRFRGVFGAQVSDLFGNIF